jgi:hypothetical protein
MLPFGGTLKANDNTWMVGGGTLLTARGTLMVDDSIVMVDDDILKSTGVTSPPLKMMVSPNQDHYGMSLLK